MHVTEPQFNHYIDSVPVFKKMRLVKLQIDYDDTSDFTKFIKKNAWFKMHKNDNDSKTKFEEYKNTAEFKKYSSALDTVGKMSTSDLNGVANVSKYDLPEFLKTVMSLSEPPKDVKYKMVQNANLLSYEFDKYNEELEAINTYLTFIGIASATSFVGSPVALVMVPICLVSRFVTLAIGQFIKAGELSYICSACLSFTTANMSNFAEMLEFYGKSEVNEFLTSNKVNKNPMWNTHPEHLWKFLLFLVQHIDFEADLGPMQFNFWNAFLNNFDFNIENPDTSKPFRYFRKFCAYDKSKAMGAMFNSNNLGFQKDSTYCNNYNDILMRIVEEKLLSLIKYYEKNYRHFTSKDGSYYVKLPTKNVGSFAEFFEKLRSIKSIIEKRTPSQKTFSSRLFGTLGRRQVAGGKTVYKSPHLRNIKKTQRQGLKMVQHGGIIGNWRVALYAPNKRYAEMLREYVIITGNTSVLLSEYVLHTNKFQNSEIASTNKRLDDLDATFKESQAGLQQQLQEQIKAFNESKDQTQTQLKGLQDEIQEANKQTQEELKNLQDAKISIEEDLSKSGKTIEELRAEFIKVMSIQSELIEGLNELVEFYDEEE